jgi:2-polyprenyl-3-methyl-5-hydroxy-6-metoxy-1,4-benzoquinol methylase
VLYSVPITPPKVYDEGYFFQDYKAQYGKTYLEDYPALYAAAKTRMARILSLLNRDGSSPSPAILDVGCAYGPFLKAARDAGCRPYGIDTADEAISSVQNKLKIPAAAVSFEAFDSGSLFQRDRFDVVAMWFVIEHFRDLETVLEKVASLLPTGGIFALSTPNLKGISGRKNRQGFLSASPEDHFTLWSPSWARRVLPDFNITVRKIAVTGHHPERFPGMEEKGRGIRWSIAAGMSRLLGLGDTFEVYGVKG